jgi:hypothetical protein
MPKKNLPEMQDKTYKLGNGHGQYNYKKRMRGYYQVDDI